VADLDLAELRRLAEAAHERGLPWSPPFTIDESLYLSAVPPAVVLQLVDRLEAAEAQQRRMEAEHRRMVELGFACPECGRDAYRCIHLNDAPAVPGAVAGEPPMHTYLVGTDERHIHDGAAPRHGEHRGLCGGRFHTASAVAAAHPSPEQRLAELAQLPVCRRCALVAAGEPESVTCPACGGHGPIPAGQQSCRHPRCTDVLDVDGTHELPPCRECEGAGTVPAGEPESTPAAEEAHDA
jgi:rubrerythrin